MPLAGTQPRGMSRSTDAGSHALSRSQPRTFDHQQYHEHAPQFPRAFPIRTQSYRRAGQYSSAPYPSRSEYRRRKNPAEYTNVPYDEPSTHHVPDLGAFGSLGEAGGSDPGYYIPLQPHFYSPQRNWGHGAPTHAHQAQSAQPSGPWMPCNEPGGGYGLYPNAFTGAPLYQASQFGHFNSFGNSYYPVLRANEHNVRAFCPPPMPTSESLPFGQNGWQPTPFPWYQERHGLQSSAAHLLASGASLDGVDRNVGNMNRNENSEYTYGSGNPMYPNMERLTLDPGPSLNAIPQQVVSHVPMGFKERAVAQAHKSYMGLLAYMQSSRRPLQSGAGDHTQGAARRFVYPKPPNPISLVANLDGGMNRHGYPGDKAPLRGNQTHLAVFEQQPSKRYSSEYPVQKADALSNFAPHSHHVPGSHLGQPLNFPAQFDPSKAVHVDGPHSFGPLSPVDSAKSSLEVLNALCEQSGWLWVDGILLSGCLHYALEEYESALSWFSRITAIHPK